MVRTPSKATILRLAKFGWRYRGRVFGLLVLQFLLLAASVLILQLGGFAIDWIGYRVSNAGTQPSIYGWHPQPRDSVSLEVFFIACLIAAAACSRAVLNYLYAISNGKFINEEMVVDLRVATFRKLQSLDFDYYNRHDTSTLLNRLTGDIQLARSFIDGVIIQVIVLAISLAFYLTAMLQLHVGLTAATLATIPLMIWQTLSFSNKTRSQYDRNRELFDSMMLRVQENIEGQTAIKAFGRQSDEVRRFHESTQRIESQQRNIFWKVSTYTPIVQLLTQINLLILLLYGGFLVSKGELPLGSGLVVFAGLLQQFSNQVNAITNITNTIEQSLAGARRVFEVLDAPIVINRSLIDQSSSLPTNPIDTYVASSNDANSKPIAGHFQVHSVFFSYRRGDMVLNDLSMTIEAKKRTAIVGSVGSGKSTFLQLLPRFYDPQQGYIDLDGKPLQSYSLLELRRSIGFVFQDPFIFSDTIFANIAYGNPEASQEKVEGAARSAAIHDFIQSLPLGYQTVLGESGLTLSGGQRQRLALARALLFDPPILILDDPTSAVDIQTEREIWQSLEVAFQDRTSIFVTNRVSMLARVDQVLFLQNGQLEATGNHEQLMKSCRAYVDLLATEGGLIPS